MGKRRLYKKRSKTRRRRRRRRRKTRVRRKTRRRKYTRTRGGGNGFDYAAEAAAAKADHTDPIEAFTDLYTRLSSKVQPKDLWGMATRSLAKLHYPVVKISCWLMIRPHLPQQLQEIPDFVRKLFVLNIVANPKQLLPPGVYSPSTNTISYLPPANAPAPLKKKFGKHFLSLVLIVMCHEMVHWAQTKGGCRGGNASPGKRACWMESFATSVASKVAQTYGQQAVDAAGKKLLEVMVNKFISTPAPVLEFYQKCYWNDLGNYVCDSAQAEGMPINESEYQAYISNKGALKGISDEIDEI